MLVVVAAGMVKGYGDSYLWMYGNSGFIFVYIISSNRSIPRTVLFDVRPGHIHLARTNIFTT